jgi:hypothetical protein
VSRAEPFHEVVVAAEGPATARWAVEATMRRTVVIALVMTATARALSAQDVRSNCTIDEAVRDDSLMQFRRLLLGAVAARDPIRLQSYVVPDVYVGRHKAGVDALLAAYQLNDPDSTYWAEIQRLLLRGGRLLTPDAFCAPYFGCPGASGRFSVVAAPDVPVHSAPSDASDVVSRLTCGDLVLASEAEVEQLRGHDGWTAIRTLDVRTGFIRRMFLDGSSLFIEIHRVNGEWRLVTLASDG